MADASLWQPAPQPLSQLIGYLSDSLDAANKTTQKKAEVALKQAKQSPDIDRYLVLILANQSVAQSVSVPAGKLHSARLAAGIMLKNDIKAKGSSMPLDAQKYIRSMILQGIQDANPQIRSFTGTVVTEVVKQAGIEGWPEVLQQLFSMIENQSGTCSQDVQDGAMIALLRICEDNHTALDRQYSSGRPIEVLVPKLLAFMSSPVARVRANAIASINIFIPKKLPTLLGNVDAILTRLFELAQDESDEVRKQICRALVQITEIAPMKIVPHIDGLVDYMLAQQRNIEDPELAQDAAEFWLCVGEDHNIQQCLGPYLPKIVPVLLESMVYNEDEVLRLEGEAEDADKEDREEDIKPNFAKAKSQRNGAAPANGAAANGSYAAAAMNDDADLSEEELEEYLEDDEDDDPEQAWNLRKCSAASLDVLASVFNQPVFEATLPYLKRNLNHTEWPNREAAVLAIGAIADGCMEYVEPHLPDLVPYLISLLTDEMPVVRQITCWSLARYTAWASHLDAAGQEKFFLPMMDGILQRMLDGNKRVQEAAASAFASLEEKAGKALENPQYCLVIAGVFAECFSKYKDRNMFILYDAVQTLADHVGETMQSPELVHSLMPAILKRWEKVADASREIFPLLECLSYIAAALGNTFSPYAELLFSRCIRILYENLNHAQQAAQDAGFDEPDSDFLVTSLDLLSALVQALSPSQTKQLIAQSQPNMFELLLACLQSPGSDIRQSAYALVGDCAIHISSEIRPLLPTIMPLLIAELDLAKLDHSDDDSAESTSYAVMNNACWSSGEIAIRTPSEILPYAENLLQRFFQLLVSDRYASNLHENAAVSLGRVAGVCADLAAPHLATFAPLFLRSMQNVEWSDEKASAMKGFCEVVLRNPEALQACLLEFLTVISKVDENAGGEVLMTFRKVLSVYQQNIPNFSDFLQHIPPPGDQALRALCGS